MENVYNYSMKCDFFTPFRKSVLYFIVHKKARLGAEREERLFHLSYSIF